MTILDKVDKRKKVAKGETLWVPAPLVAEFKSRINQWRVAELQAQIAALAIDTTIKHEPLLFGVDSVLIDQLDQAEPTPQTPSTPITTDEFSADTPKTPIAAPSQTEWVEPAPVQSNTGYDGLSPINDALAKLYGFSATSVKRSSALVKEAREALSIEGSARLPTAEKLRIYQYHAKKISLGHH